MIDVLDRPPGSYGRGKDRILLRLVDVTIARYANPDGSDACPARATLARHCDVSVRAVGKCLAKLEQLGLLRIESKAGRSGKVRGRTNSYTVLFPLRHGEMEVPHVDDDMRNNKVRHEEQYVRHGEISSHNRP